MTEKQKQWRNRSQFLWRLSGLTNPASNRQKINYTITQTEFDKLEKAFKLIKEVYDNRIKSSRELGFNAFERCNHIDTTKDDKITYCQRQVYKDGFCLKHYVKCEKD